MKVLCAFLLCCAVAPLRLSAQGSSSTLSVAAHEVAERWSRHEFAGIVPAGRVEIRLPGAPSGGPVPAEQAVVMLAGYVRGMDEVAMTVVSAMEVSPISAFAELRRRYRTDSVDGVSEETVLVGFERTRRTSEPGREGGGEYTDWRVTVVQVVGAGSR